jgi:hypothetical protein
MDRELPRSGRWIGRRTALEIGICLALTPLAPRIALAQTDPTRKRPREGDVLVAIGITPPEPLKPKDLPLAGKQTFTWPMDPATGTVRDGSRLNKVLPLAWPLVRSPDAISGSRRDRNSGSCPATVNK